MRSQKTPRLPVFFIFALIHSFVAGNSSWAIDPLDNQPPVEVEFKLIEEPGPGQPLEFDIVLRIEEGYYVYSEEKYSFGFTVEDSHGLGSLLSLDKPPTVDIPDLLSVDPDAVTTVFHGKARIRVVMESKLEQAEERWGLKAVFSYQSCTDSICLPPEQATVEFGDLSAAAAGSMPEAAGGWGRYNMLWGVLAAFMAGVALSLTPCVYPMVGITVAIIGGNTDCSRGRTLWLTFVYVLGLSLVYALTGVVVALLGSRAAEFFRSPYVLSAVGIIFVLMAMSLFDVFSLSMPTGILSRLQGVGRKGSTGGVLVMGAVSAFVVGSCISGPLISLITFVAATGSVVRGFFYFFALAWGMGFLLFVAGSASGMLPGAGAWMQRVKHVLGVVLLWAAFYFTRPVVGELVYYAATFTCLAAVLGFSGLPHFPDKYEVSTRQRRCWQLASLLALSLLLIINVGLITTIARNAELFRPDTDFTVDLEEELSYGQVVMLEFQAPWCSICKQIERSVLEQPEIKEKLQEVRVVKVHFDYNRELNRKFELIGPPAFVFLRPDGSRIGPVLVSAEDIQQAIENRIWRQ